MRKNLTLIFLGLFIALNSFAALPFGAHAKNWTLSEIPDNCDPNGTWGPTWDLYSDVLDIDKHAVIDFSAVWCGPCWSYHTGGTLETLWNNHGPEGDNTIRVFYIEIDCGTNVQCLCGSAGCNGSTQGDWTAGTNFPIFNPTGGTCSTIHSDYGITYYPTLYAINAEHKTVWEVGQQSVGGWESWLYESFTLAATYDVTDDICATNEGSIDLSPTGGKGSLSFEWSHGPGTEDVYNLSPGYYSVTITDQNGYFIEIEDIEVTGSDDPLVVVMDDVNHNLCYEDTDGEIFISVSGGQGSYNYLWSNGETTEDIANLAAGDYTVSVSDIDCTEELTVTVTEPDELVLTVEFFETTCGEDNGSIILSASGGTPPYLYSIGGAYSSQSDYYDLPAGMYTVSVKDNNDCETFEDGEVDALPEPVAEAGDNKEISCGSSTVQLDGSGSSTGVIYSYLWTTTDGHIVSGETTLTPTVDAGGTYQLKVTDDVYYCFETDETVVTESGGLPSIVIATPDTLTCEITTTTLDASQSDNGAEFTYEWTTSNGHIVDGEDTQIATVDQAGIYTYTLTNTGTGCASSKTIEVFEDTDNPIFNASNGVLDCNNTSVQLCANVTSDYESVIWTASGTSADCITVTDAGDYEFTVTGTNGCTSIGTSTATGDPNAPLVVIETPGILGCGVTSLELNASNSTSGSDITYLWTTTDGNFVSGVDGAIATVNQPGTYTLLITNTASGCSNTESVEVMGGATMPNANYTHNIDYNIVNLFGIVTVGATSTWASGGMTATGDTVSFEFFDNGDYEICHYLENGCGIDTSCSVISVSTILPFESTETTKNVTCNGADDGSIAVIATGGITDYSISWNGPDGYTSTSFELSDLAAGDYNMNLLDDGNHSISKTITITEPDPISVTVHIVASNGTANDGSINITVQGGTPPYTYEWDNGSTDEDRNNIGKGDYTLVITDANGCTFTATYSVETTATNDPAFINKFELYPNPTMDNTNVNLQFNEKIEGKLQLVDFSGKVIQSFNISTKETLINLDLKSLTQGIYMLKLESKNKVGIRKLIKL